jgi:pilus assembly protein Flp/PilA
VYEKEKDMWSNLVRGAFSFLREEDGPAAVEYAVMLALVIVVCITAVSALGSNASNTFSYVGNKVKVTSS